MIALDTNVLIYACDRSSADRQKRAAELIDRATDGVLLWQVACEFVAASPDVSPFASATASSSDSTMTRTR